MEDSQRVKDLKQSYTEGLISLDEFEREVRKELDKTTVQLNTTDYLPDQIWMSDTRTNEPTPAKMKSVCEGMMLPIKPIGGMWTSTYTPDQEYDSAWIEFLFNSARLSSSMDESDSYWVTKEEGIYADQHKWLMKPKTDLNILIVDSHSDLRQIVKKYEKPTYKGIESSEIEDTIIDFCKIAEDFDAMRLTEKGQKETRRPGKNEPNLYGWDTESTLHFRWNWKEFEYVGEHSVKNN